MVHLKKFGPIGAHWHGDVDLEVVPNWYFFAYYTLLGCSRDVPEAKLGNGDSQEEDIEPKGNGALDIQDDSPIIAYL